MQRIREDSSDSEGDRLQRHFQEQFDSDDDDGPVSEAGQQVEEIDVDVDEEGQDEHLDTRTSIFVNRPGRRMLLAWKVIVIDI